MSHAIKLDFSEIDNASDAECRAIAKDYMRRALRAERMWREQDEQINDLNVKLRQAGDAMDAARAALGSIGPI
jgi:hypothetical protein